MVTTDRQEWHGCYDDSWKGSIMEGAFAHPAKFSRGLIRRIYRHLIDSGYVAAGDTVVDPFGGVALGALDAMSHGLHWRGCELEKRFVELGRANISHWRELGFSGSANLTQGDSRRLCAAMCGADAVISSPPYSAGTVNKFDTDKPEEVLREWFDSYRNKGGGMSYEKFKNHVQAGRRAGMDSYGSTDGQLSNMAPGSVEAVVSSPPFSGTEQPCASQTRAIKDYHAFTRGEGTKRDPMARSESDGQLSAMETGTVDAVISSPPYADEVRGSHGERETAEESRAKRRTEGGSLGQSQRNGGYGITPGNISGLTPGEVEAVVSSPPFQGAHGGAIDGGSLVPPHEQERGKSWKSVIENNGYGASPGQLANEQGETFWHAAREIVLQCAMILRPGGVAVFVCKDFVRKGQRVPFSDDWRRLCEACGFELVEWIAASLVKEQRSPDLFGGTHVKRKERKSFFRRLAEKKGSPRIDHEDVLIFRKALPAAGN